ncbi:MAG: DUF1573 domain-containing protein [Phycisphaerae bacterium]|nr:DUF1573 domain-containing protein [Phycisphaerae bacterium]
MKACRPVRIEAVIWLGLALCLTLTGCRGCSSVPTAPSDQSGPPVIRIAGSEASCDLGPVQPSSKHTIILEVDNPADTPLRFRTVRGDCECVSAIDPPTQVDAGGSVKITVSYVAPKTAMEYESRLLIVTDNPGRKMISLRIKSSPPAKRAAPAGSAAATQPSASAPAQ